MPLVSSLAGKLIRCTSTTSPLVRTVCYIELIVQFIT